MSSPWNYMVLSDIISKLSYSHSNAVTTYLHYVTFVYVVHILGRFI